MASRPCLAIQIAARCFHYLGVVGDDHGYLLAIGAALFDDAELKNDKQPAPPELLWMLGEEGVRKYQTLKPDATSASQQFPDAGVYLLRNDDLYLLLNASSAGLKGRGSHGHNDALSIEVSVCGRAFIVDPGTFVYTADLHATSTVSLHRLSLHSSNRRR